MKKIGLIALFLGLFTAMNAQDQTDALRYSQVFYQGTARSMAMGNAFGALGADFSSLSTNPAGIGFYRSSEFTVSPEIYSRKTGSTYNGRFGEDARTNFDLSNLGFVLTTKVPEGSSQTPWKFYQFAFGMNRSNTFSNRMFIEGDNQDHSKIDVYLDEAYGVDYRILEDEASGRYGFDLYPAWYVYLIDTIPGYRDQYTSPVPQGGIRQQQSVTTWGSTNEWLFSGGANLNDKLFIGATVGLPFVRYFKESTYTEFDVADTIAGFDYWNYKERLTTKGWGINLKLGVIVWPVDWLRLGAAFHTPTAFYDLTDYYTTTTDAKLGPDYNVKSSPNGQYNYSLTTPLRAIGSMGIIVGKYGLLSADYEFVNYATARLRAPDYTFSDENSVIRNDYQSTYNLRFGTEWRYTNFSFRGGYAIYGSPYANQQNNGEMRTYSFGLGYNEGNFGLDLAYVHGSMQQDYYLYSSENYTTNATKQDLNSNNFVLTLRTKF
ncbi:MAG: hypothetical protein KKD74_05465 [Bacteroidetes bacterium]|nr:hypothetical protein [Bacteroidota bacterium]